MGSLFKSAYKDVAGKGGLAGLGISFVLAVGKYFMSRPGLRANAEYLAESVFKTKDALSITPSSVVKNAYAIIKLLRDRGGQPWRIAIDGVPGSGKSSLSKALAERLGMNVVCLDHQNMDVAHNFAQKKSIYEHHRLLRTQDIDSFDVIIYLDEPVEFSQKKVLQRKRGGYLVDLMDFNLLKQIGENAFALAAGEPLWIPNSFIVVKFKPEGGFQHRENINTVLHAKGIDGTAYAKEEALFLCAGYKARSGFATYIDIRAFSGEFLSALTESALLSGKGEGGRCSAS